MKIKYIYLDLVLLLVNVSLASISNSYNITLPLSLAKGLNDYNAAIEIKEVNNDKFAPYFFQYNTHSTGAAIGWNYLSAISVQKGYLFGGINISGDKDVLFRIVSPLRVSDSHRVHIKKGCTTFIKMDIIDGISSNANLAYTINNATASKNGLLTVHNINFRISNNLSFLTKIVTPILPERNTQISINALRLFLYITKTGIRSLDLVFKRNDEEGNVIKHLDAFAGGTNSYSMCFDQSEFHNGIYWWYLEAEDSEGTKYQSDSRKLIVLDPNNNSDSDGDGYLDNIELARDSDINDANDIPLILSSRSELNKGHKLMQYYDKLSVNDNRYATRYSYSGYLPDGIFLSSDGILSGIPTECGHFQFLVTAVNEIGHIDEIVYNIEIINPDNSQVNFGKGGFKQ